MRITFTSILLITSTFLYSQPFTKITAAPIGTDTLTGGYSGAIWVDYANDGDLDAFIPTFGTLVNATNRDALINNVNPKNIVCLHFLTGSMSTTPFQTLEY